MTNILIIIPARGGSKGIPRKNLRSLNGKPLIYYSIKTALDLEIETAQIDVYVSSEDQEILTLSKKFGAGIIERDNILSKDLVTLDSVICDAYLQLLEYNKEYDLVVTMQPTSPLLKTSSLKAAINKMLMAENTDTMISVTSDAHLSWSFKNDEYVPNYEKRLNRQELPAVYKETGGFLISRAKLLKRDTRIGEEVNVYELSGPEAIDIDNYSDWNICEYYLKRKKILFVVSGYKEIGMGHVYNVLSIANEILNHDLIFITDKKSQLAFDKIKENNYTVYIQQSEDIITDIENLNPDVIINDRLDTSLNYMNSLQKLTSKLINFEDLGPGASLASMVFNAMYPEPKEGTDHYYGLDYFILRDEFLFTKGFKVKDQLKNVLICFGGVDPNDFTDRVLQHLRNQFTDKDLKITVIVGMGYANYEVFKSLNPEIEVVQNITNISEYMVQSDLIFTSAGRTTFEAASIGVPTIVLCQNERETTHFFARSKYGFKNLGLGKQVSEEKLYAAIQETLSFERRSEMNKMMESSDLKNGKLNVIRNMRKLIDA